MSNKLKAEVEKILDTVEPEDYSSSNMLFFYSEYSDGPVEDAFIAARIDVNFGDNYGGEGMGDQYWSVYSFTKDGETVYCKFDGWYQSYNGAEFNERLWVTPKEKTVTVYE